MAGACGHSAGGWDQPRRTGDRVSCLLPLGRASTRRALWVPRCSARAFRVTGNLELPKRLGLILAPSHCFQECKCGGVSRTLVKLQSTQVERASALVEVTATVNALIATIQSRRVRAHRLTSM